MDPAIHLDWIVPPTCGAGIVPRTLDACRASPNPPLCAHSVLAFSIFRTTKTRRSPSLNPAHASVLRRRRIQTQSRRARRINQHEGCRPTPTGPACCTGDRRGENLSLSCFAGSDRGAEWARHQGAALPEGLKGTNGSLPCRQVFSPRPLWGTQRSDLAGAFSSTTPF